MRSTSHKQVSRKVVSMNEIRADEVYRRDEFGKRVGLGPHTLRKAEADGLRVVKVGVRKFIAGRDWLEYVARKGK